MKDRLPVLAPGVKTTIILTVIGKLGTVGPWETQDGQKGKVQITNSPILCVNLGQRNAHILLMQVPKSRQKCLDVFMVVDTSM